MDRRTEGREHRLLVAMMSFFLASVEVEVTEKRTSTEQGTFFSYVVAWQSRRRRKDKIRHDGEDGVKKKENRLRR